MSKHNKPTSSEVITIILIVVILLIAVGSLALRIYVGTTYANTPSGEVPFWAQWVMTNSYYVFK